MKSRSTPAAMPETLALPPDFASRITGWYRVNARVLPWRQDRNPYRVWVSEIMLQQTRVEAVIAYFERFMQALPTVEALAEAPEELLMKLWAGLGYYRRARYLHMCAQTLVSDCRGIFPDTVEGLRRLPGIGRYTAGAIASIAFERPAPAVDGNVLRVLSRLTARIVTVDEAEAALLPRYPAGSCGDFTQSLMELGATVCLPNGAPDCLRCPFGGDCLAKLRGTPTAFPPPAVKPPRKIEERTVFLLFHQGRIAVRRRPDRGVLAGLWELPNVAGDHPELAESYGTLRATRKARHIFTHLEWHMTVCEIDAREEFPEFQWGCPDQYPLPSAFAGLLPGGRSGKRATAPDRD